MDEKPKANMMMRVASVVLFLMFLYPLSIGPIVWLNTRGLVPEPVEGILTLFYLPLSLLLEVEVPIISELLNLYIRFWDPT